MGVAYSQTITPSGGATPYHFDVTAGALPPGLTLSPSGVTGTLSGIPARAGSHSFTLRATDANGYEGFTNYSIDIERGTATLSISPVPVTSYFGENVTLTFSVSGGADTPTGTVTVDIPGFLPLQILSLDTSGEASLSISALTAGMHTVIANYLGNGDYYSRVELLPHVVGPVPTTTTVSSSLVPSNPGDSVTFTARVEPIAGSATPTGAVIFEINGVPQPPRPLNINGEATLTTSTLGPGSNAIAAHYQGNPNQLSSSDTITQDVDPIATTTALASNPSNPGDSVTITATVAPTSGTTTPTGSVTFSVDGIAAPPVALTGGEAAFATQPLAAGVHTIEAVYSGDATHASSAGTLTQNVDLIVTTTALASSVAGENVTFTAIVAQSSGSVIPTGSVTFSVDGAAASTVALTGGEAAFATSALAPGTHTVEAVYLPDPAFGTSSASLVQDVEAIGTTTTLASSRNPGVAFEEVTFTATVAQQTGGAIPVGSVRFAIDGADVATVGLVDGAAAFPTSSLGPGDHAVEAIYEPDPPFATSSGQLVQSIIRIATTTSLSSSANPGSHGETVTFTASVNPAASTAGSVDASTEVTGTLTFSFDGIDQPPVTLAGGIATLATADLAAGTHSIVATYSGDLAHGGSVSPALEQVINDVDGTIVIRQTASGRDATFAFSSPRPELNLSITTISGEGGSGPVRLARGSYAITADDMTGAGFGLNDISCDDDDSTGDPMSRSASIELDAGETVTCTFTSVHADIATSMIEDFMATRGRMVLLARPDIGRRVDRLKGTASGGGNPASALMSYMPALANGGPIEISTSLDSLSRMADPQADPDRFDLWLSGSHFRIDGSGSYTAGTLGADYLATTKLLVGGFVMIDHLETSPSPTTSVEGTGWLAGGYLTARLSENLFLDVLGAGGTSDNAITPLGTYTDDFATTRFLASATLQGDWRYGAWTLSPRAALSWYREGSGAYVDSLGVTVPSTRSATGEFAFGPGLAYVHDAGSGWTVSPGLRLDGVLRYTETSGGSESDFLGRVETRFDVTAPGGATIGLAATADGIGSSDPLAYGGRLRISIPLN